MRWIRPQDGTKRVRDWFAWYPWTHNRVTYWLEHVRIREVYFYYRGWEFRGIVEGER